MIYVIQDIESLNFKIGVSKHPYRRLKQMQTGSSGKLVIRGIIQDDDSLEKELHRDLANWRLNGEWFDGGGIDEIMQYVKDRRKDEHEATETADVHFDDQGRVFCEYMKPDALFRFLVERCPHLKRS